MKKRSLLSLFILLFFVSVPHADDNKATPEDVYNLVLKGYEVIEALGEESFAEFNNPKGEFVYKDTFIIIERCPDKMVAHPFALDKLKDIDLNKMNPFNQRICDLGEQPGGGWGDYEAPKPGETEPSRKITYSLRVEGTPYTIMAGIFSDTAKVEELNATLR